MPFIVVILLEKHRQS